MVLEGMKGQLKDLRGVSGINTLYQEGIKAQCKHLSFLNSVLPSILKGYCPLSLQCWFSFEVGSRCGQNL